VMRLRRTSVRILAVPIILVWNPRISGKGWGIERTATKLNADKTRFDPRPVGVLLTFRVRDCSRPLPV